MSLVSMPLQCISYALQMTGGLPCPVKDGKHRPYLSIADAGGCNCGAGSAPGGLLNTGSGCAGELCAVQLHGTGAATLVEASAGCPATAASSPSSAAPPDAAAAAKGWLDLMAA